MKFIKKNLFTVALLAFLIVIPLISLAQVNVPASIVTIKNPISSNTIQEFIRVLLEGLIKIATPIIALAVIYSGFLFVQAQGNPEKITKAKDALLYTLIGAAVLLGALAIAKLVADTVLSLD